jgi:hypothetical protein
MDLCELCNKKKQAKGKKYKDKRICYRCYIEYAYIKEKCDICNEYEIIKSKKTGIKICLFRKTQK